jgi:hypothetical protein
MPVHTQKEEPWLRGTLQDVPVVVRAVLHALEMAEEDCSAACGGLTAEEIFARPHGVSSVGFHLRHIPGSLDRLLTYSEGSQLSDAQKAAARIESEPGGNPASLLAAFVRGLRSAELRVRAFAAADLESSRAVGRKELPTTVGGLLIHCAEHTSRHVGQVVTTAKILQAMRENAVSPADAPSSRA